MLLLMRTRLESTALTQCRPLVHHLARRCVRPGVELDDLLQEGFAALALAASRYRPDSGATLATYAYRAIHGACLLYMQRALLRGVTHKRKLRSIASLDAPDDDGITLHDRLGTIPNLEEAVDISRGVDAPTRGAAYTYRGKSQSLWAWSQDTGIRFIHLYNRVTLKGWTLARAIDTPIGKRQGGRRAPRSAA